jgi:hypothetical protein
MSIEPMRKDFEKEEDLRCVYYVKENGRLTPLGATAIRDGPELIPETSDKFL